MGRRARRTPPRCRRPRLRWPSSSGRARCSARRRRPTRWPTAAAEYDARVAALIADDEDLVEYVTRLESLVDDELDDVDADDDADDDADRATLDAEAVDPGELVAEVERFLRDRDPKLTHRPSAVIGAVPDVG